MGLPNINITFTTLAKAAFQRGDKGTICMILRDNDGQGTYEISQTADIPEKLSGDNRKALSLALIGGVTAPDKILAKVIGLDDDLEQALSWAQLQVFDYLVGPGTITAAEAEKIAAWVKAERAAGRKSKAVLPETAADCEGVVNFSAEAIKTAGGTFTAAQYCPRIAGILAGTPFTQSGTYAPLPEVLDAGRLTRAEADEATEAGKFILWYDGQKFKTGRAVNSLTTLTEGKSEAFQKIKIVEVMDLIREDIVRTAEEQFIGKYANSYDNRCLLISGIQGYLNGLAEDGILGPGPQVGIDIDANRAWLKEHGFDVSRMSEADLKTANTGSAVHLKAAIQILDVVEDIELPILLNQ